MTDDATPTATATVVEPVDQAAAVQRCPWCSQILPPTATVRCPHCHASLVADGDARLPGLTEVEAPSATKARRLEAPKRSKLLSWISGEIDDDPTGTLNNAAPDALAPPPRDVRREMLRIQLQAEGLTVAADGSIGVTPDGSAATADTAPAADVTEIPAPVVLATAPDAATDIRQAS